MKRDKERHSFRSSRDDKGDRLAVDLHALDPALDLNVGNRLGAAVTHGGLIAGGGALAQHSGDEIKVGDSEVFGWTRHRNEEDLRAILKVGKRRLEAFRGPLPVPRLHIGDEVGLLLRCLHIPQ